MRHVHYVYADVEYASYPMDAIDTVLDDGRIDRKSVLHFAVFGVIEIEINIPNNSNRLINCFKNFRTLTII